MSLMSIVNGLGSEIVQSGEGGTGGTEDKMVGAT